MSLTATLNSRAQDFVSVLYVRLERSASALCALCLTSQVLLRAAIGELRRITEAHWEALSLPLTTNSLQIDFPDAPASKCTARDKLQVSARKARQAKLADNERSAPQLTEKVFD